VPDVKRHAGNFEPVETAKAVPLDPVATPLGRSRSVLRLDPK
jgi:hypothetical protein